MLSFLHALLPRRPDSPIGGLINWSLLGHSVPTLSFGSNYDLAGNESAYNLSTWASTLRYRESTDQWYWIGCANFGRHTYGLSVLQTTQVFTFPPGCTGIEGNRMHKRNGTYYILNDCPSEGITEVWKSSTSFGPYTRKILNQGTASPVPGTGTPIQGSLVETEDGWWYFMSFAWDYPLGRVPVLAPISREEDGFPVLTTVDGAWGVEYPLPVVPESPTGWDWTGVDTFEEDELSPAWQWNHNPDTEAFSLNRPGLTLRTASVTGDLYAARNTLAHRLHGTLPYGVLELDFANMADGDHAGLAALKDASAWIGVVRNGTSYHLAAVHGLAMGQYGGTTITGRIVATAPIKQTRVWLKVSMDAAAAGSHEARFSYSLDGTAFTELGCVYELTTDYLFFVGYRYGVFNYATRALWGVG
ncbi:concanavalin A-like lectin/glucanase domain-containing protein [Aspergillus aurantiobrunneus]